MISKWEHVKARTLYKLVDEALSGPLSDRGFERVGPRMWINSRWVPIRQAVICWPPFRWHGTHLSWGLSLDYVPQVSMRRNYAVRWTRNPHEVKADLLHDPLAYLSADRTAWHIPNREGLDRAREAIRSVVPRVLGEALTMFERTTDLHGVVAAYEAKAARTDLRYSFMGPLEGQERLGFAFSLARLGRVEEGRLWLEEFIERAGRFPHVTRQWLRARLEAAGRGEVPPYGQ